jgi:hypothetical protein
MITTAREAYKERKISEKKNGETEHVDDRVKNPAKAAT